MADIMAEIFELFSTLASTAGPSGFEESIGSQIRQLAEPYVDEIRTDNIGNLIAHKAGRGPKILIAARQDTSGFLAFTAENGGFLSLMSVGQHPVFTLPGTPIRFLNGIKGSLDIRRQNEAADRNLSELKISDIYADIGAKDKESAEKAVPIGEPAVFDIAVRKLYGNRVTSPFCNLLGCVSLLLTLQTIDSVDADLYFVFSVKSEAGFRGEGGVLAAAYAIEPDLALAVDECTAGDTPNAEPGNPVELGGGPVIGLMDASSISNPDIVRLLKTASNEKGIKVQFTANAGSGVLTGPIQLSRGGVKTGFVGIPVRGSRSASPTADLTDVQQTADLIRTFIQLSAKEGKV